MKIGSGGVLYLSREYSTQLFWPVSYSWCSSFYLFRESKKSYKTAVNFRKAGRKKTFSEIESLSFIADCGYHFPSHSIHVIYSYTHINNAALRDL